MKETNIQQLVRLRASELGARLFRNNVGLLYTEDGRPVKVGLCTGSSDLIGYTKLGKFLALEIKKPGRKATDAQQNFIDAVNKSGGIGAIISDPNQLDDLLK